MDLSKIEINITIDNPEILKEYKLHSEEEIRLALLMDAQDFLDCNCEMYDVHVFKKYKED